MVYSRPVIPTLCRSSTASAVAASRLIPATFIGGAVFCMFCDLIARLAFAPLELNISTVTSIFGAPVVIYMMVNRRRAAR